MELPKGRKRHLISTRVIYGPLTEEEVLIKIILCAARVLDPRLPLSFFKSHLTRGQLTVPEDAPYVLSPFDEYALELALQIKDREPSIITVISLGSPNAKEILRHALAMGADEAILINEEEFGELDSFGKARVLSEAIKTIGEYDLILCGMQAADLDSGQVGPLISLNLDIPLINVARKIEVVPKGLSVERSIEDGFEILVAPTPLVITVGDEGGTPRLRGGVGTIRAARAIIPEWSASDMNLNPTSLPQPLLNKKMMFLPMKPDQRCTFIESGTPESMGKRLAEVLYGENML